MCREGVWAQAERGVRSGPRCGKWAAEWNAMREACRGLRAGRGARSGPRNAKRGWPLPPKWREGPCGEGETALQGREGGLSGANGSRYTLAAAFLPARRPKRERGAQADAGHDYGVVHQEAAAHACCRPRTGRGSGSFVPSFVTCRSWLHSRPPTMTSMPALPNLHA